MRVGRSRPPPPPPPIDATDWLLSTIFAVFLAFAHVTAVSKTTTTAKYFTHGAHPLCLRISVEMEDGTVLNP
jgi:hypothetical protein